MPQAILHTTSDADFRRTFQCAQRYPAWVPPGVYVAGDLVDHGGKAWTGAATSINVEPGTDPTKWTIAARPPVDLTGSTLRLQVRRTPGDPAVLVDLAIGSGITIEGSPTLGRFTPWIPLATLRNMAPANYAFALIRGTAGGVQERILWGTLAHDQGTVR